MAVEITYGSEYVFNSAKVSATTAVFLDSTHFIVSYGDHGNSGKGTSIIGTISAAGVISYGAEAIFSAGSTVYCRMDLLDSTHCVVMYQDGTASTGSACVGTISGTTITFGSEYSFNSVKSRQHGIAALSSTSFVVSYRDDSGDDDGYTCVGNITSGDVITFDAETSLHAADVYYTAVAKIDSTHFVAEYRDSPTGYGAVKIGTISGNTTTYGIECKYSTTTVGDVQIRMLDSTHFIMVYRDTSGKVIIGTISGTTATFGTEYEFSTNTVAYTYIDLLDSTHFVVTYRDITNSNYGTSIIGTIDGATISFGTEKIFNTYLIHSPAVVAMDSTHFVIAFEDDGSSEYGTGIYGTVTGIPSGWANTIMGISSPGKIDGIVVANIASVNSV